MSDYLTRVVERAMGEAAAVRPLVAPLFAPVTGSGAAGPAGAPGGWIEEGTAPFPTGPALLDTGRPTGRRNPGHRPVAGMEAPAARPAPPSLPSAAGRPAKGVTASRETPESLESATGNRRGNGHAQTSPVAAERPGSIPAGAFDPSGSDAEERPHAGHHIFQQASRVIRRRTERQSGGDLLAAGEEGTPHSAGEGAAAVEPGRTASAPARSDVMLTRSVPRGDQPLPRVVAEGGSDQRGEAALPTIRISIGRIDVRATAPQPAVHKVAAPPAPKVSLDDYLRKQSGGAR